MLPRRSNEDVVSSDSRKQRLKNLLDQIEAMKLTVTEDNKTEVLSKVDEIIHEADEISRGANANEGIPSSSELIIDAHILYTAHQLVGQLMENTFQEYDEKEYIKAIKKCVEKEGESFWERIGNEFLMGVKMAKFQPTMLGAFDREEVEVEDSQVPKRKSEMPGSSKLSPETKPESIQNLEEMSADDADDDGNKRINYLCNVIRKLYKDNGEQPIPFYKLIIDPNSFSNSAFNAFQLSFLVKGGNIALGRGSDGYPVVRLPTKEEAEESEQEPKNNKQAVLSFNVERWEELVKFYDIKVAMLPSPLDFE